jgi:hypothetical protein
MKTKQSKTLLFNPAKTETLGYLGIATVARHGATGYRYRHRWATGAQDLVFESHSQARKWINPFAPGSDTSN